MGQSVIINGVTYTAVPSVTIPKSGGGTAVFYDTTGADAAAGDILTGKSAFSSAGSVNGSMANNGTLSGSISTKAGTYTIPSGYTSGGSVGIASAEQSKLVSGNIRSGVTILGVAGSTAVVDTSDATATASTIYKDATAWVNGSKITGQLQAPVISQDATTKVLSIS
jgi:hypothetical protein